MNIIEKHLPVKCYARQSEDYKPRRLNPLGILQHYISAINVQPADPFDLDRVYQIFLDYRVSCHYLIDRNGDIYELVPPEYQAWHAGESAFKGMRYCNRFMFGIENMGMADVDFLEDQYISNAWLCANMMESHNITLDWMTGHETVAPGRKVDPGERFDWLHLRYLIEREMSYE